MRLNGANRLYQRFSQTLQNHFPHLPTRYSYNITTCEEKKFLWYRVAKVGSRSILSILKKNNLFLDAAHPMFCHYSPQSYDSYFKFSFVRNPWDRLVSCWHNKVVNNNYFKFTDDELLQMQSFDNFVEFLKQKDIRHCDHHLRLQSKLIDLNEVDFIGRFENFDEDLLHVTQTIGIDFIEFHRNPSKKKDNYQDYYTDRLIDEVAAIYHRDISIFNYDFA